MVRGAWYVNLQEGSGFPKFLTILKREELIWITTFQRIHAPRTTQQFTVF
jgi:hypothetical protein